MHEDNNNIIQTSYSLQYAGKRKEKNQQSIKKVY